MLTLLTVTGARPRAWSLCQLWMARQTYAGPVHWVVVDDGPEPATWIDPGRTGWTVEWVRPQPLWQPGQNTQARNLAAGLARIGADARVLVIEDDDWYAPDWLEHAADQLDRAELVGEGRARYYNVATRVGRQLSNGAHASLCSTALRGWALNVLRDVVRTQPKFIDLNLWKRHGRGIVFDGHRVVGIKGLPGRGGIGMGHHAEFRGTADPHGALLQSWVGADAELYP
jgi:hypothetical protein